LRITPKFDLHQKIWSWIAFRAKYSWTTVVCLRSILAIVFAVSIGFTLVQSALALGEIDFVAAVEGSGEDAAKLDMKLRPSSVATLRLK
jgi:hypothetical protein